MFGAAALRVEEAGYVAHEEGFEGRRGGAHNSGIYFGVAPEVLLNGVPCVVG